MFKLQLYNEPPYRSAPITTEPSIMKNNPWYISMVFSLCTMPYHNHMSVITSKPSHDRTETLAADLE